MPADGAAQQPDQWVRDGAHYPAGKQTGAFDPYRVWDFIEAGGGYPPTDGGSRIYLDPPTPWYHRRRVWLGLAIVITVFGLAVGLGVGLTVGRHSEPPPPPPAPRQPISMQLSFDELKELDAAQAPPWGIANLAYGIDNGQVYSTSKGDTRLRVFYPKGSYSPSATDAPQGGLGFYACIPDVLPADDVIFRYRVAFADNWNPVRGGKLPGMYISKGCTAADFQGGSGGCHTDNASCRLAWRPYSSTVKGSVNGTFDGTMAGETYVYLPTPNQDPSYRSLPDSTIRDPGSDAVTPCAYAAGKSSQGGASNVTYGDSLWRGLHAWKLNATWNDVSIHIRLNSFDAAGQALQDGLLRVTINQHTEMYEKLIWRLSPDYHVSALLFSTFFGGSTPAWATPEDTNSYYADVSLDRLA